MTKMTYEELSDLLIQTHQTYMDGKMTLEIYHLNYETLMESAGWTQYEYDEEAAKRMRDYM
jgi:hypothetical protein